MRKTKLFAVAALVLASAVAFAQSEPISGPNTDPILEPRAPGAPAAPECAGRHYSFRSTSLLREMSYCLLLPTDYESSGRAYPVLYLLHGLWGSENDWLAKTNVAEQVRALPLIVVMPQADDSWYVNAATRPEAKYEDYVLGDLVHEIEGRYRIEKTRDARFIAGLSMGGYGALKAGLKQPQQFAVVGAFSSTFDAARGVRLDIKTPAIVFGPADSATRKENDVLTLIGKSDPSSIPYVFVMTGLDDPTVLRDNRDFLNAAQLMKLRYEYHEVPGQHEWPFWERSLEAFLRVLKPRLK
jgi:putative tributyrin esterase